MQLAYIQEVFTKYYFDKANPTNILINEIVLGLNISTKMAQTKKKRYQKMICLLLFLIIEI